MAGYLHPCWEVCLYGCKDHMFFYALPLWCDECALLVSRGILLKLFKCMLISLNLVYFRVSQQQQSYILVLVKDSWLNVFYP